MVKKNIYFLHPLGEKFIIGTPGNSYEFLYTNEIIGEIFKLQTRKDKIYLYSDYLKNTTDDIMQYDDFDSYLYNIHNDNILHKVLKGDGEYAGELSSSYMIGTNYITMAIDDNSHGRKRLLNILKSNTIFMSFIMNWENKKVVSLDKMCLCLGYINGRILFL